MSKKNKNPKTRIQHSHTLVILDMTAQEANAFMFQNKTNECYKYRNNLRLVEHENKNR